MIEKIPDLPSNVLGFRARGTVSASDYEAVIIPEVEAMFSTRGKVRLLYHLGEDFAGFKAGAVWDDTKLGMKHLGGWERVAIITDTEWIRAAVRIFALAIPGHVRVFHNGNEAEAKDWVCS